MHTTIAAGVGEHLGDRCEVVTVTLDDPEHGLTEDVLARTDVLVWWGHAAHAEVADEVVDRVHRHVLSGLGLVVLHSGHWSKIFMRLMGTTCTLRWRSEHDRELIWTVNPTHPIASGVPHPIVIDEDEMYGEFFDIPVPDYPTYHHPHVRRVIANGVEWTAGDRRERSYPTLLRYATGDFFAGQDYAGPLEDGR